MKNIISYTYRLKINTAQKVYIQHYLHRMDHLYKDMCKRCRLIKPLCEDEILQLLRNYHKYDVQLMEEDEITSLIFQLQKAQKGKPKQHCYCTLSSPQLLWHHLSLKQCLRNRKKVKKGYCFAFARLYERNKGLYITLYYKRRK